MSATPTLLAAALAMHDADLCVLPTRTDGSKAPDGNWKAYQQARPSRDQVQSWFSHDRYDGLGVITGAISGNLEMLELEGRANAEGITRDIADLAAACGLGDLWHAVTTGYLEVTPSGGIHLLYRVTEPVAGNTRLASRPANADELAANPADRIKVLIETRGEGGFTVCAPSAGRTHPTGRAWHLAQGGPATITTITGEQRDALHDLARTFHTPPEGAAVDAAIPAPRAPRNPDDPARPGDDYNARADWSTDILGPAGWTISHRHGPVTYWRRPGNTWGMSATTGRNDADNLWVFSTSTDFDAETPYSKFGAYTLLHHGGDWTKAARALAAAGYGQRPPEPSTQTFTPAIHLTTSHGNLATVHQMPAPAALAAVTEATYLRSDDGNALALCDAFGDMLRHDENRGRWLAWDGVAWKVQTPGGGVARELAKRVARQLDDNDQAAVTHKRRSLGAAGTSAMLQQAATDSRIAVGSDQLDAHPWDLNTPGGIIDLRTGTLHPSNPDSLHTRTTRTTPDPAADPAVWDQFLADTFGGDVELIAYLQRLVGYSSTGHVGAHVLPFCHGSGGNGKGVFLEAVAAVLGDYATSAPVGFLMEHAHAGHETEIARLHGARMVLCSEVNETDRFDEAKVKQLTGGDTLTARFMRQDHFTFTPSHHLWLMGNAQPGVRTGGHSFWRRLRLIPFTREVPEASIIEDLQGVLARDHGPAILAWIVAGAVAYHRSGLNDPPSVRAATDLYARDQDTVTRFLEDAVIIGGGEHVKVKIAAVRAAYEQWCHGEGEQTVTAKALAIAINRAGCPTVRSKSARFHSNLTLVKRDDDDDTKGDFQW